MQEEEKGGGGQLRLKLETPSSSSAHSKILGSKLYISNSSSSSLGSAQPTSLSCSSRWWRVHKPWGKLAILTFKTGAKLLPLDDLSHTLLRTLSHGAGHLMYMLAEFGAYSFQLKLIKATVNFFFRIRRHQYFLFFLKKIVADSIFSPYPLYHPTIIPNPIHYISRLNHPYPQQKQSKDRVYIL